MFQSSTVKRFFVVLALAIAALTMLGCAAPQTQAVTNETVTSDETAAATEFYGYNRNEPNGTGGNGAFVAEGETTEDVGYRGGSGAQGAGSDSCDPAYDGATDGIASEALTEAQLSLSLTGYGAEGALSDAELTVADMLMYALQDEYLAHAEYEQIIADFGSVRPFTNIIKAEQTHIDSLLPLFAAYGLTAPADDGAAHTLAVSSLTESYQAGVGAEVNNIAMYETFLAEDLPDDVRTVFESLMRASENHLRAFQNRL
ncbi:MAG: DUF2202 domain-containing protein [Clostridiaceae bacterium]